MRLLEQAQNLMKKRDSSKGLFGGWEVSKKNTTRPNDVMNAIFLFS
jgi:hypothetical protein